MGKKIYAETIKFLNKQPDRSSPIVIEEFLRDVGYIPGTYKYRNGKWHVKRDGIWYPITYANSVVE